LKALEASMEASAAVGAGVPPRKDWQWCGAGLVFVLLAGMSFTAGCKRKTEGAGEERRPDAAHRVESALAVIENVPARLELARDDCTALAAVLRDLGAAGSTFETAGGGAAEALGDRGESAARRLPEALDQVEPALMRCGEDENFLQLVEGN